MLADEGIAPLLEKVDRDLASSTREGGCRRCGDKLHCDNYPRKPRGGPGHWDKRLSFTCAGKRHRTTPPSVRFLGRKVYVATVVVLLSAMRHGLSRERVELLRERLGIDRRTLERWRKWWLESFVQSRFWKAVRARLVPTLCERTLPLSLCEAFEIERRDGPGEAERRRDRLLDLLRFLSPLTGSALLGEEGF